MPRRLTEDEIASVLLGSSAELDDMALELRALVLGIGPQLDGQIAFHVLCYSVAGRLHGAVGGNVCMIGSKRGRLQLAFIHGASLPDPRGLLEGEGKAKRRTEWVARTEILPDLLEPLIGAAIEHDPTARGETARARRGDLADRHELSVSGGPATSCAGARTQAWVESSPSESRSAVHFPRQPVTARMTHRRAQGDST